MILETSTGRKDRTEEVHVAYAALRVAIPPLTIWPGIVVGNGTAYGDLWGWSYGVVNDT